MRPSRPAASLPFASCRSRRVQELISESTAGRGLGIFGEPGVNVTELNLALDQEAR